MKIHTKRILKIEDLGVTCMMGRCTADHNSDVYDMLSPENHTIYVRCDIVWL